MASASRIQGQWAHRNARFSPSFNIIFQVWRATQPFQDAQLLPQLSSTIAKHHPAGHCLSGSPRDNMKLAVPQCQFVGLLLKVGSLEDTCPQDLLRGWTQSRAHLIVPSGHVSDIFGHRQLLSEDLRPKYRCLPISNTVGGDLEYLGTICPTAFLEHRSLCCCRDCPRLYHRHCITLSN